MMLFRPFIVTVFVSVRVLTRIEVHYVSSQFRPKLEAILAPLSHFLSVAIVAISLYDAHIAMVTSWQTLFHICCRVELVFKI